MHIRVIEPAKAFLSRERVKAHLNIESSDTEFDDLVDGYVAAAVAWLDGPDGWLGRCLGEQVLELTTGHLDGLRLPLRPLIEVVQITLRDDRGGEATLPPEDFCLFQDGALWTRHGLRFSGDPEAVKVRYRAGYRDVVIPAEGETPEREMPTVPAPIQQAVLLLVGQWFKTRENVVTGTIATALPFAVEALLSPYRVWR